MKWLGWLFNSKPDKKTEEVKPVVSCIKCGYQGEYLPGYGLVTGFHCRHYNIQYRLQGDGQDCLDLICERCGYVSKIDCCDYQDRLADKYPRDPRGSEAERRE